MSNKTGGPAFPVETKLNPISNEADDYQPRDNHVTQFTGMTLRDYFAAKSLPLASTDADGNQMGAWMETRGEIALRAYRMADAMLKARNG